MTRDVTSTRRPRAQLALALILLLIPSSLLAWGREGHEIIATLAEQRLQPEVRDAVVALLDSTPFVEASTWADRVRNNETAPWHYVNIDLADIEYDALRVCPKAQCVIGQIERFRNVLAKADEEVRKRQKALKYLIHFVGDLHQPLHAADNHDHGGNDVQVAFLGQEINPYSNRPWNLHAVWDSGILETHDPDAHHYAERLNAWLATQPEGAYQDGSVVDWGMESHRIAKEHVYVLPADRKLGEDYYRANVSVVDQQLAKAGVRLAKLLNDAFQKKERPRSAAPEPRQVQRLRR